MNRPAPRRSGLHFRVLLLVGVGALVPASIVLVATWSHLSDLDARMLGNTQAEAAAAAARIDGELMADLEALQRIASSLASGSDTVDPARDGEVLRRAGNLGPRFAAGVFLLDAKGRPAPGDPHAAAAPPPDLPELQEVLRTGKPGFSGLVPTAAGQRLFAMVSVMSWRGPVAGVVAGLLDPHLTHQAGLLRDLARGRGGRVELVDAAGRVVASTDRERLHQPGTCAPLTARLVGERRGLARRCVGCHEPDAAPAEVLAFAPLASAPWGVSMVRPEAEVLASSGAFHWGFLVAALGGVLLAGGFARGAARSVTRPLELLTARAEGIAEGKLDEPIPELGDDEVGRLGRSLDRMRASLAEAMAAVERSKAALEERVAERTRELHAAYAELQAREEQRARLLRTVITAQEDERKRIARELHDETTQGLAVLVMGLETASAALRSGGPVPRLDEVKALAVHLLDEIHRLILDLRPSVLDDLGLFSAVRWFAERHLGSRGVAVRCEAGREPKGRLPPELEIAVFRICQEALQNVARHARAESVLVQMEVTGRELRIEIEDDGRGFDPGGPLPSDRPHYGLLGIRERVEILGGTVTVDSAPGKGTRVVVRVPVPSGLAVETPPPFPGVAPGHDSGGPGGHNGPGGGR